MSLLRESGPDDQQLVRYLLRLLPDEEADRLDEMSIADDALAWRVREVENDLVDAYVSGTLTGETLQRFESSYLSSERRREKVRFAGSFLDAVNRQAGPADTNAKPDSIRPAAGRTAAPSRRALPYRWIVPRSTMSWRLAAAAALVLLAVGALLFLDVRLRNGLNEAQRQADALNRRAHDLEAQLKDQRAANAEAVQELQRVRSSLAALGQQPAAVTPPDRMGTASRGPTSIALVLLPQTRGVGPIATLAVPQGTDRVTFHLRLESNEFRRYEIALKDPATGRIVWRSGRLTATSSGDEATVSAIVPANVLKPQHYSLELSGRGADGRAQVAGSYAVRIAFP
jgi:hypothetical protein